jgi:hypothetical protein
MNLSDTIQSDDKNLQSFCINENNTTDDTDIPRDTLLTRKDVADILKVDPHTLSTNRKKWEDVLPMIRFKGSNIIRYRRSDVLRLIEQGYKPAE